MINLILKISKPFIKWWGKIHFPFTHKKITGKFYFDIRDKIAPWTVLLTTTYGEFSNLINPAELKHGAIYLGEEEGVEYVLESTGKGVIKTDLISFLMSKDEVVGLKPLFGFEDSYTELNRVARKFIGIPYDYLFKDGKKSLYCFELVVEFLKYFKPEIPFKKQRIIGKRSYYDHNTFMDDKEKFKVIFDSRT